MFLLPCLLGLALARTLDVYIYTSERTSKGLNIREGGDFVISKDPMMFHLELINNMYYIKAANNNYLTLTKDHLHLTPDRSPWVLRRNINVSDATGINHYQIENNSKCLARDDDVLSAEKCNITKEKQLFFFVSPANNVDPAEVAKFLDGTIDAKIKSVDKTVREKPDTDEEADMYKIMIKRSVVTSTKTIMVQEVPSYVEKDDPSSLKGGARKGGAAAAGFAASKSIGLGALSSGRKASGELSSSGSLSESESKSGYEYGVSGEKSKYRHGGKYGDKYDGRYGRYGTKRKRDSTDSGDSGDSGYSRGDLSKRRRSGTGDSSDSDVATDSEDARAVYRPGRSRDESGYSEDSDDGDYSGHGRRGKSRYRSSDEDRNQEDSMDSGRRDQTGSASDSGSRSRSRGLIPSLIADMNKNIVKPVRDEIDRVYKNLKREASEDKIAFEPRVTMAAKTGNISGDKLKGFKMTGANNEPLKVTSNTTMVPVMYRSGSQTSSVEASSGNYPPNPYLPQNGGMPQGYPPYSQPGMNPNQQATNRPPYV